MRTFARVEHAIFPRIAAVAETGWSPKARKDYADFLSRLPAQLRRYRALGIDYAQTPFAVRIEGTRSRGAGKLDGRAVESAAARRHPLHHRWRARRRRRRRATTRRCRWTMPVQVRAAAFVDGQPLAAATDRHFDAASLLQRDDEALAMCSQGLMLRLEDDGPLEGPRAIYNVDIFNPCWLWRDAPLDGIAAIKVRAGRIPYYFQLAGDEANRKFRARAQRARRIRGPRRLRWRTAGQRAAAGRTGCGWLHHPRRTLAGACRRPRTCACGSPATRGRRCG